MSPQHHKAIPGSLRGQGFRIPTPALLQYAQSRRGKTGKILDGDFFAVRTCSDSIFHLLPTCPAGLEAPGSQPARPASQLRGLVSEQSLRSSRLQRVYCEPTSESLHPRGGKAENKLQNDILGN